MRLPRGFRQQLEQAFKDESFSYNYGILAEIAIKEFRKIMRNK